MNSANTTQQSSQTSLNQEETNFLPGLQRQNTLHVLSDVCQNQPLFENDIHSSSQKMYRAHTHEQLAAMLRDLDIPMDETHPPRNIKLAVIHLLELLLNMLENSDDNEIQLYKI